MINDCELKLSAARTKLILDKPFLGALVLRLPMIEADPGWCRSVATDARAFYYNPEYIDALSVEQTQFVLAHEALHCALSHFARRMHREKHRWDLACDLAINPLLIADGLTPCPDALYLEDYAEMTAEEIYPCLDEHENMMPHDDHVYDKENEGGGGRQGAGGTHDSTEKGSEGGDQQQKKSPDNTGGRGDAERPEETRQEQGEGEQEQQPEPGEGSGQGASQPPPLSKEEMDDLSVQWQQRMAGAAQQAMQAGKLSGPLRRIIDHLLQPQLPWRMLLARYMNATARDDYNYARPSRREGDYIMPSLKSHELDVVVALDVSGSVTDKELTEFVSEVNALKAQIRARITLLACDSALVGPGPWLYEPWEEFALPQQFQGGGSTDFRPVFQWLDSAQRRPDLVVWFTDAQGHFPAGEPACPVVWLVKGKARVPWGQRIQLN